MKLRLLAPLLLVAALLAGCGSSGPPKVQSGDVAEVAGQHITLALYNEAIATEEASMKAQGSAVPKAGTSGYSTMQTQVISLLVQDAEFLAEAQKLHLSPVTAAQVQQTIDTQIIKKEFSGSKAKYDAALKAQGFTDAELHWSVGERLLAQKLYNQVTKAAKATPSQIAAYYEANIASYSKAASRQVREILAGKNKQALAESLYSQLKAGGSWTALAKKYSQDPGSKDKGGLFTANKGSDVAAFDAAVFAPTAKTGVVLKPVNTPQYGWFVIEPLANTVPATVTPEKKAAAAIRTQLDSTQQNQAFSSWVQGISKSYCNGHQISYQAGYAPSPDPCASITAPNQTTT